MHSSAGAGAAPPAGGFTASASAVASVSTASASAPETVTSAVLSTGLPRTARMHPSSAYSRR
ncbi:hypothetical protein ACF1BE_23355 [Streptomyces sp. NPDC014991]|uniref:hypothetical protein n=1 Tax=Streptomyces sp. NPDC014991 TaxID=3364935 RepID=UPI0036F5AD30